jgi:hypothetical protein
MIQSENLLFICKSLNYKRFIPYILYFSVEFLTVIAATTTPSIGYIRSVGVP